jgi:LmbE family N-acetylglucosaminyl deacetylase
MKLKSTICLSFLALFFSNSRVFSQQEVSFYFAAHEDDWQLFMGKAATIDVLTPAHVVFVTLTAGDDGDGNSGGGIIPYFQARENGAVKSVQFIANLGHDGETLTQSNVKVNKHRIKKYVYKNTVMYFLRIVDGDVDGSGFGSERGFGNLDSNQSLQKLRTGQITHINTVDRSTVYNSWSDLTKTLQAIINLERRTDPQVWINIPETDEVKNPGDHSDHINTGIAAQAAVASLLWVGIASYIDYHTKDMNPNLSTSQIEDASALLACTVIGMTEGHYNSNWETEHLSYVDKEYFRISRSPVGSALLAANLSEDEISNETKTQASAFVFNVHPNPINKGNGMLNADIEMETPGNVKFYLQDASGNVISKFEKNISGKEQINIPIRQDLAAGVYYITVIGYNNKKETRKILIQ